VASAVLPYKFQGGNFEVHVHAKKSVDRAGRVRREDLHTTISAENVTTSPHYRVTFPLCRYHIYFLSKECIKENTASITSQCSYQLAHTPDTWRRCCGHVAVRQELLHMRVVTVSSRLHSPTPTRGAHIIGHLTHPYQFAPRNSISFVVGYLSQTFHQHKCKHHAKGNIDKMIWRWVDSSALRPSFQD
jgi:hypothetical protein